MYLSISNLTPVAFYGYTSCVLDQLLEETWEILDIKEYRSLCFQLFKDAGIPAQDDNKIVFEFKTRYGQKPIFIGFYDGRFSVGLACRTNQNVVIGL